MKKCILLLLPSLGFTGKMFAQGCSVCTQTVAGLGETSAHGLNNGILYLAAIPLLFIGTVGIIWYRRNKVTAED